MRAHEILLPSLMLAWAASPLGACGGAPRTPDQTRKTGPAPSGISVATKLDACALITREEAAAALGEPVREPKHEVVSEAGERRAAVSQCIFEAAASPRQTVNVLVRRSPMRDSSPSSVRETLKGSGVEIKEVAGVGDGAFWGGSQLHAFKGEDLYLIVSIFGLRGDGEAQGRAKVLAQKALSRV